MARRLTENDKIQINEVYAVCRNYTKTAEITGFSVASVKKYVIPDYEPAARLRPDPNSFSIPSIEETIERLQTEDELCLLHEWEKEEIELLQEDLLV